MYNYIYLFTTQKQKYTHKNLDKTKYIWFKL